MTVPDSSDCSRGWVAGKMQLWTIDPSLESLAEEPGVAYD
jgi:hypothetical protein